MLLFCSCSNKVPEYEYKVYEDCLTKEKAVNVATFYWSYKYKYRYDKFNIKDYDIDIIEKENSYYIRYRLKQTGMYAPRGGGLAIEISKIDCSIVYVETFP